MGCFVILASGFDLLPPIPPQILICTSGLAAISLCLLRSPPAIPSHRPKSWSLVFFINKNLPSPLWCAWGGRNHPPAMWKRERNLDVELSCALYESPNQPRASGQRPPEPEKKPQSAIGLEKQSRKASAEVWSPGLVSVALLLHRHAHNHGRRPAFLLPLPLNLLLPSLRQRLPFVPLVLPITIINVPN